MGPGIVLVFWLAAGIVLAILAAVVLAALTWLISFALGAEGGKKLYLRALALAFNSLGSFDIAIKTVGTARSYR